MTSTIWFNAHHAPIGAFATFTLGMPGARGGFGLELGKPADQNIYIGLESTQPGCFEALPFYAEADSHESARYDVEQAAAPPERAGGAVRAFPAESVTRDFRLASDTWRAGDLTVTFYSPVRGVPDPAQATAEEMQAVLLPAILVELTVDNTHGATPRTAFFGDHVLQGSMRRLQDTTAGQLIGVAQQRQSAIAVSGEGVESGLGFTITEILQQEVPENLTFGLSGVGAVTMVTPPGERRTFRLALCFYRDGLATAGIDTTYYYARYFANIEAVAQYALAHFDQYRAWAAEADALLANSACSADQQFMLAHAIRGYYGSTEFLDYQGKPFWVVNEGEYRMMNTFDLTVDQLFYEMRLNPWTVRNELDMFAERYSYQDTVHFPHDTTAYPGGRSFTHDMGVANTFSRAGYSSYERFGLDGCFSHMTHEQLVNWICCAAVYAKQTADTAWLTGKLPILRECLQSLLNRDHPDPAQRNGVMGLDSSRVAAEITTYDSLDVSLGQARNNLYMAVKTWAAYVALEKIFAEHELAGEARTASAQADRCAATLVAHVTAGGYIPAVMAEDNDSKIIPAIEGLVFPWALGYTDALDPAGRFGALLGALRRHLETVLVPGVCLFPDGGWKLSSTSDNSWLSKIYLCQFVARHLLGFQGPAVKETADAAHVAWLLDPRNIYMGWSDQMIKGIAQGSKYYPRGVTGILWLAE